jgi:uncharacterized membrane protein YgaE (UPF0421/DUF939 family)
LAVNLGELISRLSMSMFHLIGQDSVVVMITVVIVIMVIPIAFGTPPALVFIPPPVIGGPAVLPRFM